MDPTAPHGPAALAVGGGEEREREREYAEYVCVCNEELVSYNSERVVDTSRNLLKCVGGVGAGWI